MLANLPGLSRHRLIGVVEWVNENHSGTIQLNAHEAGSDANACLFVQTALDAYGGSS